MRKPACRLVCHKSMIVRHDQILDSSAVIVKGGGKGNPAAAKDWLVAGLLQEADRLRFAFRTILT